MSTSAFNPNHIPALTTTFGLLSRGDAAWTYQDKVFALMTPEWGEDGKTLTLRYSRTTPTATFDNKLANELKAEGHHVHAVPLIRNGSEQPAQGEWLVSGGLLLSNPAGELITFERTVTNPSGQVIAWPKAINNPMGRIDTLPSTTCYKEGAEEIFILGVGRDTNGAVTTLTPHMFTANGQTGISLASEHALQAKAVEALMAAGKPLEVGLSATQQIKASHDPRYDSKLTTVIVVADNIVVDSFRAVAIPSPAERTIEMAMPLQLSGSENTQELRYIAREPFGRAIKMVTPEQMEAYHYGWAMGLLGTVEDAQQKKTVNLGGILPILQGAILGLPQGVSRPEEVVVPKEWTESRVRNTLGL
jgi:hypothetical protein